MVVLGTLSTVAFAVMAWVCDDWMERILFAALAVAAFYLMVL